MHAGVFRLRRLGAAFLVLAVAATIVATGFPLSEKAQAYVDPPNYTIGFNTPARITKLIYPTMGNPAIVKKGTTFVLEYNPREDKMYPDPLPVCTNFAVSVTTTNGGSGAITRSLAVEDSEAGYSTVWPSLKYTPGYDRRIYLVTVRVPETLPADLYNVSVNCTIEGNPYPDSQTNALNVVDDFKTKFNFVQLSDIHVYGPENEDVLFFYQHSRTERGQRRVTWDPGVGYGAEYYHKAIQQINRLKPDFCVLTGDYDFGQRYYWQNNSDRGYGSWGDRTQNEFEHEWFYQETQKFEVPVFIVIGNHDGYYYDFNVDGRSLDQDWFTNWTHLYSPLYYTFNYGDNKFFALNSMDWAPGQRFLQDYLGLILQPSKYLGAFTSGGDNWQSGCTQARLDAINVAGLTGQLGWLRDKLAASQGSTIRIAAMHHDPWKADGYGGMWESGTDPITGGMLDMGNGPGRLAAIRLMKDYKVSLMVHGHDHSDCSSEDDSQKALLDWSGGGGHCISANTTSTAFQGDGSSSEYPGYRRVWVDDGDVIDTGGNENLDYFTMTYASWPFYAGTNVGGTTNLGGLSTPGLNQNWSPAPGPAVEDASCYLTSDYDKALTDVYMEFPMHMLSGNYYYQVSNGTFGETYDVSGSVRMNQVFTPLNANQSNKQVRVYKSAAPDNVPPFNCSVSINGGAATTDSLDVTLTLHAEDALSGVGEMMISNQADFAGAQWEKYRTTRDHWMLAAGGSGLRTVYVKFRDRCMPGNEVTVNDTITYNEPSQEPRLISAVPDTGERLDTNVNMVVTGANTNFQNGQTAVTFSGNPADFEIFMTSVQSSTQCTCIFNISGTAALGPRDITVTTGGEVVTLEDGFEVGGEKIIAAAPSQSMLNRTLDVAITGEDTHFINMMDRAYFDLPAELGGGPSGIIVNNSNFVDVIDDTHCVANITVPSYFNPAYFGVPLTIRVTQAGVDRIPLEGGFMVVAHQPKIILVNPTSGAQGQTMNVGIIGEYTAFEQGTSVASFGAGITVNTLTVVDDTHATANITIGAAAAAGPRDVDVNTGPEDAEALVGGFTVRDAKIASVAPSSGSRGDEGLDVTIVGTNTSFSPGVSVASFGQGITVNSTTVTDPTHAVANIDISYGANLGTRDVNVVTGGETPDAKAAAFTVFTQPPRVDSISPSSAPEGGAVHIDGVYGAFFKSGSTVKLTKAGQADIPGTGVAFVSSTRLSCDFNLTGAAAGPWNVVVTNPDLLSGTLAGGFNVLLPFAPDPSNIIPSSGICGTQVSVTIYGSGAPNTGFYAGAVPKLKKGGTSSVGTEVVVVSPTEISCKFDLSGLTTGLWDVEVTNIDAQSDTHPACFTVETAPVPALTALSPQSGPVGTSVTLAGIHFGFSRSNSCVTFNGIDATEYTAWSDTAITCKVPAGATSGGVMVSTVSGVSNAMAFNVTTVQTTGPTPTWYLAEGTSDYGFDTYVTIQNPNASAVTAEVTYMTKDGPRPRAALTLPAMSQTVINPRNDIGSTDFSTKVECREGKTIAVDRRMIWRGAGSPSPEGHSSVGVTAPDKTWYLAEGSSKWGFETWLLIQNPNATDAQVTVTYMIEGQGPQQRAKTVPANSRASYNMETDVGQVDASIMVESANVPVIPERAMYRNNRREGHDSIGTTTPANNYYLAEGTTDWGFTTYVLVQNPGTLNNTVTITYMTPTGPVVQPPMTVGPSARKTVCVNDVVPSKDLSIKVSGTQPLIAERAMYWDKGLGQACHDSIGMADAHSSFFLPDGETYNGTETWTLVQNPNDADITVELSYLTPDGQGIVSFTETVLANSRKTFNMGDRLPAGRAGIMVRSTTPGQRIMVERAMYWNGRGAGTDTIGGYAD